MAGESEERGGWLGTFTRLRDHLLELGGNRLELFSLEVQEARWRLVDLLVRLLLAAVLALLALLVFTTLIVLLLPWPPAATLAGLLALYAGGATVVFAGLRRRLREDPPPFRKTIEEFRKDREWLGRKS